MLLRRSLLLLLALLCATLPVAAQQPPLPSRAAKPPTFGDVPLDARVKIAPDLLKQLLQVERASLQHAAEGAPAPVSYIVHLTESAPLDDLANVHDLPARRAQLVERLQRTARNSQAPVRAYLAEQQAAGAVTRYASFWIINGLVVESNLNTALTLAQRADVAALTLNHVRQLPAPQVVEPEIEPAAAPWNITRIRADRVWNTLGVTGQGIVVANLDTGVDWAHPALQAQYRGYNAADPAASSHDYNWYDPTNTYPSAPGPNRPAISSYSDHGTHAMGTLVGATASGSEQIGVAPGAQWVAVKVFDDAGKSTDEWIHRGFEWCLAPTRLDGSDPDPSLAPDIVSNSWGDDENTTDRVFEADIAILRAAGILTVFAAGNNGPGPGTVGSPASLSGVFAVGATDSYDNIAGFSARGPSPWGEIKPEVSAPGVAVRSSIAGGGYGSWSGTSMATPHVAGLAALLWSADRVRGSIAPSGQSLNPTLTITSTEALMMSTAVDLGDVGEDNVYGHGRIDAFSAVNTMLTVGSVAGDVTDAYSGEPLPGVVVTLVNTVTGGQHTATSQADGRYDITLAEGAYSLTATRYGYAVASVPGVVVLAATQTTVDLPLDPLPMGTLHGRVTRASDGQPLPAVVDLPGLEVSTPVDALGHYTLTVEAGPCDVRAMPSTLGYRGQLREALDVPADGVLIQDFALDAAPRLLLVDADAGVFSTAAHYGADLSDLLYVYDLHRIVFAATELPTAQQLAAYDVVIWSQPVRSPGYIGAWDALSAYLDSGGRLLISGQDIGYWDEALDYGRAAFHQYLHAAYASSDGGLGPLSGVVGSPLEGLTLLPNTADSAGNQATPDVVRLGSGLAEALLRNGSGDLVGLAADACGYRVAYLSVGLEGVGPAAARQETLDRLLGRLLEERPQRAVALTLPIARRSVAPAVTARYHFWVANTGQTVERYSLSLDAPMWAARILDPHSLQPVAETNELAPCESLELLLEVDVPRTAIIGDLVTTVVRALSAEGTSASAAVRTGVLGAWIAGPTLPEARRRHAVAAADCDLVVIGGMLGESTAVTDSVALLDLTSGQWRAGAPKPTPAADAGAATLDGRVFVVGGLDPATSPQTLSAVEVYDPVADAWSTGPALPVALSGAAVATHDGHLYVFGGRTDGAESASAYALDPALGVWTPLAPLPGPVSYASAAALEGGLYVLGGWPERSQVWRYDPAGDTWSTLAPMRTGRQGAVTAAVGGLLYVAGGGAAWAGLGSAERYDPATDTWDDLPVLLDADRAGGAGAYVDGRLYVLGGTGVSVTDALEYLEIDVALGGSYLTTETSCVAVGGEVSYTLQLRNPADTEGWAAWTHTVPPDLVYIVDSATVGVTWDGAASTLAWSGALAADAEQTFSWRTVVNTEVADETLIAATATLQGMGCGNRSVSTSITAYRPTLAPSTKTVEPLLTSAGDTLHYRIVLANEAPVTVTQATLVDAIPAHTTLLPDTLTGGALYNPTLERIEWTGDIPPALAPGPAFEWVDATLGQALALSDDAYAGPLDLGFEFEFYGNRYDQIYVNSNGMLSFGEPSRAYANVTIPFSNAPNNYVAPFWDDLVPGEGGVYLAVFGQAPLRYAVIEWHRVRTYHESLVQTFEVLLFEGSNQILFQYGEMTGVQGSGSSATVGIENATGTAGVLHLLNGNPTENRLYDGLVLEMVHPSTKRTSTHLIAYDVRVDPATPPLTLITNTALITDSLGSHERTATTQIVQADLSASSKTATPLSVAPGEVVTYTLRLVNTGSGAPDPLMVTDTLPVGLTLEPGTLTPGATYDAATREIRWAGTLWPQNELTLSYAARTDAGLASGVLINTAVLRYGDVTLERRAAVRVYRPGDTLLFVPEFYAQLP